MRLKIVNVGEPVLRETAQPLNEKQIASREIQELIDHMRETMRDAPGVGLAAPQVGLGLQLAVIEDRVEYHKGIADHDLKERGREPVPFHVLINPQIELVGPPAAEYFEGCLSLPGFTALVARAAAVRVTCLDHHGKEQIIEARGWYARILQHEIDHLHGHLYVDRMHVPSFMTLDNYTRHWKEQPVQAVRQALKS